MLSTQILRQSNSWIEFDELLQGLNKKEKGDCFEALTKYYFLIDPVYSSKLQNVWDLREVPTDLKKYLNLPNNDEGIDLIAETKESGFWAIQCKYRSNQLKSLTRHHIDTFTSLTFINSKNFELALVCTTADRFSHKLSDFYGTGLSLCCGDVWRSLDQLFFQRLHSFLDGKIVRLDPHQPRPHQQTAITKAYEHFVSNDNSRGKLIMPCASGKSLASYWMAKTVGAKKILLAVPSLALIRQTLQVWAKESQAEGQEVHWVCVCSDPSVKDVGKDDPIVFSQDLGILVQTDPDKIAEWLKARSDSTTLVITTYQSGKAIAEAASKADFSFDLGIMDEAHKTVGNKNSLFSHLLYDENILIKNRLFMTATERRYKGRSEEIVSMEDPEIYGDTFYLLSFKQALECQPPILSDYKIVAIVVTQSEVAELIKENILISFRETDLEKPEEAETLATAIALRRAMQKYPTISHALSFHGSVNRARVFKKIQNSLITIFPKFPELDTFHVSGKTPTAVRSRELDNFASSNRALITNARCLTEGIDVPGIDCVVFADPKKSTIDIVQATGRALRPSPGKKLGYVIIPLLIEEENPTDQLPNNSSFNSILTVLRALASNDERIIEYFRDRSQGRTRESASNTFEIDLPLGHMIHPDVFNESLELQVLSRLAKYQWRQFSEAREFARYFRFKSRAEWRKYCSSDLRLETILPDDIPSYPEDVYKDKGWISWGDWLGSGNVAPFLKEYRSFEDAREFVKHLGLVSQTEWTRYCLGALLDKPKKPNDIPANPYSVYKDKGWISWGDWLGNGNIAPFLREYRSFEDAREFARRLGLRNRDNWQDYCSDQFPDKVPLPSDIPSSPDRVYKNAGWKGWGDWLGTGNIAVFDMEFRPFKQAREFVHNLGLKSRKEWGLYCKGKFPDNPPKPSDIPSGPGRVYRDTGWKGWGDWLGTGTISVFDMEFRPFKQAREFVHSLGLKSVAEWKNYCMGKLSDKAPKPKDIPTSPPGAYKDKGWQGWGDWLGTGNIAPFNMEFRPFKQAREFVHNLGLKSRKEWGLYCKGKFPDNPPKPNDVPASPGSAYKDAGWQGWGDWLGTGTVSNRNMEFRSFEQARNFARNLGLRSKTEWGRYSKGELPDKGARPKDIPANPPGVYKDKGWIDWPDWLGTNFEV